jgi:dihydrofolate synthase/folylpolyglutamate synthase
MNYSEARNYIENTGSAGIVPGTDIIRELLGRLGNPENELKVIHVAGTNGKGSVCTYLECALLECGLKVGRYASPSVFRYLERIRLGGSDITENEYASVVSEVRDAADGMSIKPTGFEAETAAAFLFFRKQKADVVIVECGMGGKEDATNVFSKPLATVFAPVSMDHMSFLGSTPEEIAINKAGIMRKGCPAVIAHMPTVFCDGKEYDPEDVLKKEAYIREAVCISCDDDLVPEGFVNPLPGIYQHDNLNTALHTLNAIKNDLHNLAPKASITDDILISGVRNARWPGRYERVKNNPVIIRDGAHNPGAARALRAAIESDPELPEEKKIHLIMGVFKDKDYEEILRIMLPIAVSFTAIDLPDRKRGLPASDLAAAASKIGGLPVRVAESLDDALRDTVPSEEDIWIVFGSLSIMQLFNT